MNLRSIITNIFSGILLSVSAVLFVYGEYAYIMDRSMVNVPGWDGFGSVIAMGFFVVCTLLIGIALRLIPRWQKIQVLTYLGWGFVIATLIYCWIGFRSPGPKYMLKFFWFTEWINPVMGAILLRTAYWLKQETAVGVHGPQSVSKPQPVDSPPGLVKKFERTNTLVSRQVGQSIRDLSDPDADIDSSYKFGWAAVGFLILWGTFYFYKTTISDEDSRILNVLTYGSLAGLICCLVGAFWQTARFFVMLPVLSKWKAERDSLEVQVDKYDEELGALVESWGPNAHITDSQDKDFNDRLKQRDELWEKYLELKKRIRKYVGPSNF